MKISKPVVMLLFVSAVALMGCSSTEDSPSDEATASAVTETEDAVIAGGSPSDVDHVSGAEQHVEEPELGPDQEMGTSDETRADTEVLTYESPATWEPPLVPVEGSGATGELSIVLLVTPRDGTACITFTNTTSAQISKFEVLRGSIEQGGVLSASFDLANALGNETCVELDLDLLNDMATDSEGFYITAINASSSQVMYQSSGLAN